MKEALNQAKKALKKDEVPVGAIIVKDGKIIAKAYNTRNKSKDATNHAEIIAIKNVCYFRALLDVFGSYSKLKNKNNLFWS